ncbi:hypothetical protein DB313_05620 (plasmid) [Borrelia turcica IST7]|uniref:Uncharacterized protein n=1 Tax=Borrelia turcica IST7 TaxID=1104446 RepID=A0A386PQL8_9SPIR|nr:hypothetical protein [Borrelia turcica]AYE36977.1 hypothetical protein DB313_05620 [Borrelia turcica IST7]
MNENKENLSETQNEDATAVKIDTIEHPQVSNIYIGSLMHNVSSILKFANIEHPTINKIVEKSRLIDELVSFTQDIYNTIIADGNKRDINKK